MGRPPRLLLPGCRCLLLRGRHLRHRFHEPLVLLLLRQHDLLHGQHLSASAGTEQVHLLVHMSLRASGAWQVCACVHECMFVHSCSHACA